MHLSLDFPCACATYVNLLARVDSTLLDAQLTENQCLGERETIEDPFRI